MALEAVFFDLDGTLADTAPDLVGALATVLQQRGLPAPEYASARALAGHGSVALLGLAGITPEQSDFSLWQQDYLSAYQQRAHQGSRLFDGVNALLQGLAAKGLAWGIITNKPQRFAEDLLLKLGFACAPAAVVCGDTCAEAKPSVLPMHHACRLAGVAAENCLYVGDAERDMQAGRAAGMQTVLARWGYIPAHEQPEQWDWDFAADTPVDILSLPCFIVD